MHTQVLRSQSALSCGSLYTCDRSSRVCVLLELCSPETREGAFLGEEERLRWVGTAFLCPAGGCCRFCEIGLHPLIGVQPVKLGAKSQTSRLDSFDSCNLRSTTRIALWHSSCGLLRASVLGSKQAAALGQQTQEAFTSLTSGDRFFS